MSATELEKTTIEVSAAKLFHLKGFVEALEFAFPALQHSEDWDLLHMRLKRLVEEIDDMEEPL